MNKKLALTLAFAVALVSTGPLASTNVARAAEPVHMTLASTAVAMPAGADVVSVATPVVELSPLTMSQVRGGSWFSKIVNVVKKAAKWVWNNRDYVLTVIDHIMGQKTTTTTTSGPNKTEYWSQNATQNDYYDANGNLVSSNYSEDAEVFQYAVVEDAGT